jgi:serine/threonine protein kinase
MRKDSTRGLAVYDGDKVFIEWKSTTPAMRSKLLPRAEKLAALLNIRKAKTFQSLTCRGLLEDDQKLGFVYHNPLTSQPLDEPKSLHDLFSADDRIKLPSLSDRIRLALRVAQVVRNFHHTGWLHKGLRSDNILFFNVSDVGDAVHDTDLVLAGFNFARLDPPTEISEQPSANLNYDIYRHPEALEEPSVSFSELMDVYSLGTILLEIAEWKPLRYLVKSVVDRHAGKVPLNDLTKIREFLLSREDNSGTSNLRRKTGDIYASACTMCLNETIEVGKALGVDVSDTRSRSARCTTIQAIG